MMTRIISGILAGLVMLAILFFGGAIGMAGAMAILAAAAVFELLRAAEFPPMERLGAMALAVACPLLVLVNGRWLLVLAVVYGLSVCVESVVRHAALPPERAALKVFLPAVAVAGFSALSALRAGGQDGLFYIFLALVIPWFSDMGAYFTGVFFGKHKLCPVISPKKTVEGFLGGIAVSMLASVLTAFLYIRFCGHAVEVQWLSLLAVSLIGAPLSVMGDLFASVIKRRYGVKDYGQFMPGHGGVMDRFDSVIPVALLLILWVQFQPIVGTFVF